MKKRKSGGYVPHRPLSTKECRKCFKEAIKILQGMYDDKNFMMQYCEMTRPARPAHSGDKDFNPKLSGFTDQFTAGHEIWIEMKIIKVK